MALVKATADFFNCKDLTSFIGAITTIHPFEGVSRSTFYSCTVDHVTFFVKVSLHTDTNTTGASQVDIELEILKLLGARIIRRRRSPCVLGLVTAKTCRVSRMTLDKGRCTALCTGLKTVNSIADAVLLTFCRYRDMVAAGLARDRLTFIVLDRCDVTFEDYLRKYTASAVQFAVFRSMLFMLIHVFCVICEEFPDFWHGDLHLRNVMLCFDPTYVFSPGDPKYIILRFDGAQYAVPYLGMIPKVIDFGHSQIPSLDIQSPAAVDPAFRFRRSASDLLFFFHCVYTAARGHPDIMGLLAALEPTLSYTAFYTPKIKGETIATAAQMLGNRAFDYRVDGLPDARYVYDEYR